MNDTDKEEITQIGKCILSVDRRGDTHIDCKEPIEKMIIEKSDMDLVHGVTETVQKYADIIKKER